MIEQPSNGADEGPDISREVPPTGGHPKTPLRMTFSRRQLVAVTIALTSLLVACAVGVTELLISRQHEEFAQRFSARREAVKEEIDRHEARIRQLAVTFQIAKEYLDLADARAPISQARDKGKLVQTVPGSKVTPQFSVVSTLTSPVDSVRLTKLIELARYASTFALSQHDHSPALSQGFIYTPDKRFLATFPPLSQDQVAALNSPRATEDFIGNRVAVVEKEVERQAAGGAPNKVLWVNGLTDPLTSMTTTYLATSIYDDEQRRAAIVLSIPCNRFNQYFLHNDGDPHFFAVSCESQRLLGINEASAQEMHWAQIILRAPWVYQVANERPQRFLLEGSFFIFQRVPGPRWVAVYAYTWKDLLDAIALPLLCVFLVTVGGCGLAISGAFWFNREVIRPSKERLHSLLESEAFSRSIIQVAPVSLIVVARSNGAILLQNGEAQSLQAAFAGNAEIDSSTDNILARAGALVRHHAEIAAGSMLQRFEMEPALEIAYAQAKYRGDEVFVIGMVDLAKRKEIERRLRESRARAEAESHEKGMFLATMSHEIRTPLHGALGNLELLSQMGLTQEQRSRLLIAQDSFGSLLSLINGVLDLSKIEAGELFLHEQSAHIDQLVEQAIRTFAVEAQKKGLRLRCLIGPEMRGTWICDASRFMQIATNLIGNAVKFTSRGAITVSLSSTQDGHVRLRVADSGRGIPEDELEKIFVPYVQGSVGPRSSRPGTGLGLALCQKIAGAMGGSIVVESEVGVGSIFTVALPLRRDAAEFVNSKAGRFDFVVNCDIPSWRDQLVAQLRAWYPESRVSDAEERSGFGTGTSTIFIHARDWLEIDSSVEPIEPCRRITLALDGPLDPVVNGNTIVISAYSGQLLRDAIEISTSNVRNDDRIGAARPEAVTASRWRHASILVVEDDRVSALLMSDQLRMLGIAQVDVVSTADDGIRRCLARTYDLVITDSNLPDKSGAELLAYLRAQGITWPVILCTADATVSAATSTSFDALIIKPSSLDDLSQALGTVLGWGNAQQVTPAAPGRDRLLDVFSESWIGDKEELRLAVQTGSATQVLKLLHRIQGALMILDGGYLLRQLEGWTATIAQSECVVEADCEAFIGAVESWLAQRASFS